MKELILTCIVKKELRGGYSSLCPELDVASRGDTIEEAKKNLIEAVQCHAEAMIETGDINLLLEEIGITREDLKKHRTVEILSGTIEVPIPL